MIAPITLRLDFMTQRLAVRRDERRWLSTGLPECSRAGPCARRDREPVGVLPDRLLIYATLAAVKRAEAADGGRGEPLANNGDSCHGHQLRENAINVA